MNTVDMQLAYGPRMEQAMHGHQYVVGLIHVHNAKDAFVQN